MADMDSDDNFAPFPKRTCKRICTREPVHAICTLETRRFTAQDPLFEIHDKDIDTTVKEVVDGIIQEEGVKWSTTTSSSTVKNGKLPDNYSLRWTKGNLSFNNAPFTVTGTKILSCPHGLPKPKNRKGIDDLKRVCKTVYKYSGCQRRVKIYEYRVYSSHRVPDAEMGWREKKEEAANLREEIAAGDDQYEVKTVVERFQTPHNHAIVSRDSAITSGTTRGEWPELPEGDDTYPQTDSGGEEGEDEPEVSQISPLDIERVDEVEQLQSGFNHAATLAEISAGQHAQSAYFRSEEARGITPERLQQLVEDFNKYLEELKCKLFDTRFR